MSVCLTRKQTRFFKYAIEYKERNGFYPSPTEAAKEMNSTPGNITALYGSIFLRGGFTGGKGQTRYHADAHFRSEFFKERASKARNAKKPVVKKVDKKAQLATLLVKLLSNEKIDSKKAFDMIASLSE